MARKVCQGKPHSGTFSRNPVYG